MVVGDVDESEDNAQFVAAFEVLDAFVDVLGVEAVVFETRGSEREWKQQPRVEVP